MLDVNYGGSDYCYLAYGTAPCAAERLRLVGQSLLGHADLGTNIRVAELLQSPTKRMARLSVRVA
jgi:hypothetical protein